MKAVFKLSLLAASLAVAGSGSLLAAASTTDSTTPATAPAGARAAAHPHPRRHPALRAQMARRLNLSDEQRAQLKDQHTKTAAALKAIRSDSSLSTDQKRQKARETLQAARADFRGVLTPEQQTKLDRMRSRLRERLKTTQ